MQYIELMTQREWRKGARKKSIVLEEEAIWVLLRGSKSFFFSLLHPLIKVHYIIYIVASRVANNVVDYTRASLFIYNSFSNSQRAFFRIIIHSDFLMAANGYYCRSRSSDATEQGDT